jgi:hypothetical protein
LGADAGGHLSIAYQTSAGVYLTTNRSGSWRTTRIDRVGRTSTLDLGLDAAGHVYVAFGRSSTVVYVLSNRSGTWRTMYAFKTSADLRSLSVTGGGRLHLLLETDSGSVLDRTNRTGTWRTVTLATGADFGPALSLDRSGHVTAAWTRSGSVYVDKNRTGTFRTTRLTTTSSDRLLGLTTDTAGHRFVLLDRTGLGSGLALATDRTGSWVTGTIVAGDLSGVTSASLAIDAGGFVNVAYTGNAGGGYASDATGVWIATPLPQLDRILLVTPDDATGIRVVGTRGTDLVAVRTDPGGWIVDVVAAASGLCQDARLDASAVIHAVCEGTAGIVLATSTTDPWTTDLAVPYAADPNTAYAAEAVAVTGAGVESIAFGSYYVDTASDSTTGTQHIATNAGPWAEGSAGVVGFLGRDFTDLDVDPIGHRHLLIGGSGLVETNDVTGSWVSEVLPVGSTPTIGEVAIDATGVETVAAETGTTAFGSGVEAPIDDAGIVILTR